MGKGRTVLVAALTATLVTGAILGLAVPRVLNQAQRRMLIASASIMADAFNALARSVEARQSAVQVETPATTTTTTWPVPNAALKYAN